MHRTKVLLRHHLVNRHSYCFSAPPALKSLDFLGRNGVFDWGVVPAAEPLAVEMSTCGWKDHFDWAAASGCRCLAPGLTKKCRDKCLCVARLPLPVPDHNTVKCWTAPVFLSLCCQLVYGCERHGGKDLLTTIYATRASGPQQTASAFPAGRTGAPRKR